MHTEPSETEDDLSPSLAYSDKKCSEKRPTLMARTGGFSSLSNLNSSKAKLVGPRKPPATSHGGIVMLQDFVGGDHGKNRASHTVFKSSKGLPTQ